MSEGKGLWLVDGKVQTSAACKRVWKKFEEQQERFYKKQQRIRARQRKENVQLAEEFDKLQASRPYTPWIAPWVGRADSGAVKDFVDNARVEAARRRR